MLGIWNNMGVYPRARGGAGDERALKIRPRGLSPRTRGSRFLADSAVSFSRSIPAHAGEPST